MLENLVCVKSRNAWRQTEWVNLTFCCCLESNMQLPCPKWERGAKEAWVAAQKVHSRTTRTTWGWLKNYMRKQYAFDVLDSIRHYVLRTLSTLYDMHWLEKGFSFSLFVELPVWEIHFCFDVAAAIWHIIYCDAWMMLLKILFFICAQYFRCKANASTRLISIARKRKSKTMPFEKWEVIFMF